MRWHLLNTFDAIYVLDLHGNAKKKEVSPDGSPDKNVFDIQQGVAIIIAVKKKAAAGKDKPLAKVLHGDLWGTRSGKYDSLREAGVKATHFEPLSLQAPQYVMTRRDYALEEAYLEGFGVQELMPVNSVGIVTARDALTIDMDKGELWRRVQDFAALPVEEARTKYQLGKDVQDWQVGWAQGDVKQNFSEDRVVPIAYRPFDTRWTYYTGTSRGFICRPRDEVMRHAFKQNLGLSFTRTIEGGRDFADVLVFDQPITHHSLSIKEVNVFNPLYLYPEEGSLDQTRRVNFDPKIWRKLRELARDDAHGEPDEIAIFDYIYGVLHSPDYRETFAEFLKIDFPRIPYPASPDIFWHVSEKGGELRRLHLMEPAAIGETPYPFMGEGDGVVDKPSFDAGSVWINKAQRFEGVPEIAWNFYIGGYQPAQKWLKDRKGRALSFADIQHYQRIIKVLFETHRIMGEIELPIEG
ncbi:adenine specific DNA methyltransferase [Glycocaulis alkaliphilus]|uniref:Adenine specific DNA methyltransferase n=2 Tax=Glycocaulis alkaliphilus TaxID=1434191 RepID=A0A3T0ECJ0_9PROT|nr:type ISP restriction/modification enzyme [Glycocaulis alkaliphilus]AZU05003.1 adenine specific DNA methyltransferase [Glycocaulis alkaliphilus]